MRRVFVFTFLCTLFLLPWESFAQTKVSPWAVDCPSCEEAHAVYRQPQKPAPACNKFTFDATSSYDPNNKKLTYLWNFGDGATSTEPVVTHIYEKGGDYNVTLSVTDNSGLTCDTSTTSQTVKVNTAPQCLFTSPDVACVESDMTFDASGTTDDSRGELSCKWDFGDGTTADAQVTSKKYEKPGTYKVKLIVNDNAGSLCSQSTCSKTVSIGSITSVNAGEDIERCVPSNQDYEVALRAQGPSGKNTVYTWDFGDGESASGKSVTHTYKKGGNYMATVRVDDQAGLPCSTAADTVNIKLSKQPMASFVSENATCVGTAVDFDATGSADPDGESLAYSWDFGDGTTAQGAKASHAYEKSGVYKAILTVDNGKSTKCSVATFVKNISVSSAPSAALANESIACVNERVMFDASESKGRGLSYSWDFGDGTTVEGSSKMTHEYAKGGDYTVRVTVDDKNGTTCSSDSATSRIKINTPPIANAGPNLVCCADVESKFDGSKSSDADNDSLRYTWDFGDGATAEGAQVSHKFSKGGSYRVVLTVDDGSGTSCSKSSSSFVANVNEQPVAVIKVK